MRRAVDVRIRTPGAPICCLSGVDVNSPVSLGLAAIPGVGAEHVDKLMVFCGGQQVDSSSSWLPLLPASNGTSSDTAACIGASTIAASSTVDISVLSRKCDSWVMLTRQLSMILDQLLLQATPAAEGPSLPAEEAVVQLALGAMGQAGACCKDGKYCQDGNKASKELCESGALESLAKLVHRIHVLYPLGAYKEKLLGSCLGFCQAVIQGSKGVWRKLWFSDDKATADLGLEAPLKLLAALGSVKLTHGSPAYRMADLLSKHCVAASLEMHNSKEKLPPMFAGNSLLAFAAAIQIQNALKEFAARIAAHAVSLQSRTPPPKSITSLPSLKPLYHPTLLLTLTLRPPAPTASRYWGTEALDIAAPAFAANGSLAHPDASTAPEVGSPCAGAGVDTGNGTGAPGTPTQPDAPTTPGSSSLAPALSATTLPSMPSTVHSFLDPLVGSIVQALSAYWKAAKHWVEFCEHMVNGVAVMSNDWIHQQDAAASFLPSTLATPEALQELLLVLMALAGCCSEQVKAAAEELLQRTALAWAVQDKHLLPSRAMGQLLQFYPGPSLPPLHKGISELYIGIFFHPFAVPRPPPPSQTLDSNRRLILETLLLQVPAPPSLPSLIVNPLAPSAPSQAPTHQQHPPFIRPPIPPNPFLPSPLTPPLTPPLTAPVFGTLSNPRDRSPFDPHETLFGHPGFGHAGPGNLFNFRVGRSDSSRLRVKRSELLVSSVDAIMPLTAEELRNGVTIQFVGEEGVGQGVDKEWFSLVSMRLFDTTTGLFAPCPSNQAVVHPRADSSVHDQHLRMFEFAGRFAGLAIRTRVQLGVHFSKAFFKALAKQPVTLDDLQEVDSQKHRSLSSMLSEQGVGNWGLNFVTSWDFFGQAREEELVLGGANIDVDDTNKHQFVELAVQQQLVNRISAQVGAFRKGVMALVDSNLKPVEKQIAARWAEGAALAPIGASLWNLHMGGELAALDVGEWRRHTSLMGYQDNSQVIENFWRMVTSMSPDQRRGLLQFWTGCTHLPPKGFSAWQTKPQLVCPSGAQDNRRYPKAQTCFMKLLLPSYSTYPVMCQRFWEALHAAGDAGFQML